MNQSPSLAITICATKSYTYALVAQARRIQAALLEYPKFQRGSIILVGDTGKELARVEKLYREELLPAGFTVTRIAKSSFADGLQNYKPAAQLIIARMRSLAFCEARRQNADFCWSLDSDVLPQANSLECMDQSLEFSKGFYSVSTCNYASQGGGDYLGGRGTPTQTILPTIFDDERLLPKWLQQRLRQHHANKRRDVAWHAEHDKLNKLIAKYPAKGDVFFLNSRTGVLPFASQLKKRLWESTAYASAKDMDEALKKPKTFRDRMRAEFLSMIEKEMREWPARGFRMRGWFSGAYPAIGLGCIVPVDWCGFGCTYMGRRALAEAQFDGYDGRGTEDLYIVWKRWYRKGLRINAIPHAACDHVIRDPKKKGHFILLQAHHEQADPQCIGHLRMERRPWFQQADGEVAEPLAAD